jgi:acetyl-CoA/propionyl-CoA carboxylase carboxyl transferase subunit
VTLIDAAVAAEMDAGAASGAPRAVPSDARGASARLGALFDDGSPRLLTPADDSGVLAARGRICGVDAVAFASDATVQGGAMGSAGCEHIVAAYAAAMAAGAPIIGLWHSGGARLREGVVSLHAVGRVFYAMTQASGKIPQISVVLGPAAGGAAYGPALTDLVILGPAGRVFVTGPDVVRSVTGEDVDALRLGGPEPHGRRSGVVHIVSETDAAAIRSARELAVLLAHQGRFTTGDVAEVDLGGLLPADAKRAYDVHPFVEGLLDAPGVELHAKWAPNIVTTLGRLGGRTVGVVANNPLRLGGCLDSTSAEKAARFVRMCDALGVPLVVVVDVPGYLPGIGQEWDGVVRRGAKLLHAFAECSVPRVTLVTRKAYGGAYIAMNSRSLGATRVFAWPSAEVAVMGAVAAVRILHRRKLTEVADAQRAGLENELAAEHDALTGGLARAMDIAVVDEIVEPSLTRGAIIRALAAVPADRGMHGNIPL